MQTRKIQFYPAFNNIETWDT